MAVMVQALDTNGLKMADFALDEAIFDAAAVPQLLHDVVKMQLANRRQGTASTRTRSDVRGGGKKPWKQKGTGRARAGSSRSPLWRGGGTVFGPKPRSYSYAVPRQVRAAALRAALSDKVRAGQFMVLESLSLEEPSTKAFKTLLEKLGVAGRALIITERVQRDDATSMSCRNLPYLTLLPTQGLNVYDILRHDVLIMTKNAVSVVEEAWKP
ncbi:50S ribosomal protein L4 [Candidatus Methylomirabilis limnetica]|jgi:large subunit ribosomal protein L4|uniref:Large ribosomal subunit protein uL4 n=1 Tax=Candidatus Methylomirabilis limnetica TaxID=2033718 RepID=A0A2T4TX75_9BACT|nr:50S ribosomal protein L4 [Candidatus Methylomirabilis limnetica]PTL35711.1 50S ribosomal protein L4 [Candidatus Methylomirabilis limnetica]